MFKKEIICLVIPTLQSGGMERVMSELAGYLAENKHIELHLVLYGKGRNVFYSLPENIIIHKPAWPFDNNKRLRHTVKTLLYLRRTVRKINPDTILSYGEYWNSFVLLALKGLQYPVYVSDRCQPDKFLGALHERLRSWLYPGAAGIIAQTSFAKGIYLEKGLNRNIKVIGNPIRKIKKDSDNIERENIVLTVGRLIDTKHHDRLIDIFNQTKPDNWRLVIIGGNAIKQDGMGQLREKIIDMNLNEKVTLTGTISNVEEYYMKSKIFAFTSSSEGFPNVIGEAMSAGLPVISYDCVAGPSDMIEDERNGYLITLYDDRAFKKKLERLMKDTELREKFGKESEKLIKQYSLDKTAEKYFKFITKNI